MSSFLCAIQQVEQIVISILTWTPHSNIIKMGAGGVNIAYFDAVVVLTVK